MTNSQWFGRTDSPGGFGRSVEVVCHGDNHGGAPEHVAWLFPDAPLSVNAHALLIEDEPTTMAAALVRQRKGESVRPRFRLECPVCGSGGTVVTGRAEVLMPLIQKVAGVGVTRLDLYSLQRYLTD